MTKFRARLFPDIRREEGFYFLQRLNACGRKKKVVIVIRNADKRHLLAGGLERSVFRLALRDRNGGVVLAVQKQDRTFHLISVPDGRRLAYLIGVSVGPVERLKIRSGCGVVVAFR